MTDEQAHVAPPHVTTALTSSDSPAITTHACITVLASSRAVLSGKLTAATIIISLDSGKILSVFNSILPPSSFPHGTPYRDHSPHILLPGLTDTHVHLNEPGRTEWEGFWTGTRAAASGGVTTVIDMPLNAIPPTTTAAGLNEKLGAAQGQCWVDVGFYGGIVPGNVGELKGLISGGVRGFKGFLIESGVGNLPIFPLSLKNLKHGHRWTSFRQSLQRILRKHWLNWPMSQLQSCFMLK